VPAVPPLIDFLATVLTDPAELAAFRHAPAGFLAQHGYEGIDDEDAVEALSLVADTLPPPVAASFTRVADRTAADERMDALYDVREGFDEPVDPVSGDSLTHAVQAPDDPGEPDLSSFSGSYLESWGLSEPEDSGPDPAEDGMGAAYHLVHPASGLEELDDGVARDADLHDHLGNRDLFEEVEAWASP
jgi:hypothetical protein